MNEIYCWGLLGNQICVLADNLDDAWSKASIIVKDSFGDDYTKDDANLIVIRNGMFCAYNIWEMQ